MKSWINHVPEGSKDRHSGRDADRHASRRLQRTGTKVLLGAYSMLPGTGGISRVARLLAKVLSEQQQTDLIRLRGLTLGDGQVPADLDLPVALARGSKLLVSLRALRAALTCSHFMYDGCHLAQVHGMPLLSRRPFLAFIHGIEIWENAKPRWPAGNELAVSLDEPSERSSDWV
jgi:hypothetical protein